jgi:hypothetical protein
MVKTCLCSFHYKIKHVNEHQIVSTTEQQTMPVMYAFSESARALISD